MSLYTKYRPTDWKSVIGQDFIVKILQYNLKTGNTGHAYIFTGSRGTGKTTSARIFAKALNCENLQDGNPCHTCKNCQAFDTGTMVDIIEIDAASHTSVDNIREILEESKFLPTFGKYKIYIIDEVHMLSKGAFNALLKTLEEPPSHIKFILATTEIHKVPETIQSRVQRFDFQKISEKNLIERLKFVTESEKIEAEKGSIETIARLSRGGMRDALTLLEQFALQNTLRLSDINEYFSLIDEDFSHSLVQILFEKKYTELEEVLKNLKQKNLKSDAFFEQMMFSLRNYMRENIHNENFQRYDAIFRVFREAYASIGYFSDHFFIIETTLMQAINIENNLTSNTQPLSTQEQKRTIIESKIEKRTIIESNIAPIPEKISQNTPTVREMKTSIPQKNPENNTDITFSFRELLSELKNVDPVVGATLKNASFKQNGNLLQLFFTSKWNVDKMHEPRYQNPVLETLKKMYHTDWSLEVALQSAQTQHDNAFDDIF